MKILVEHGADLNFVAEGGDSLLGFFCNYSKKRCIVNDPVFTYNVDIRLSDIPDCSGQIPISYMRHLEDTAFLYRLGFSLGKDFLPPEADIPDADSEEGCWYDWLLKKSVSPRYLKRYVVWKYWVS